MDRQYAIIINFGDIKSNSVAHAKSPSEALKGVLKEKKLYNSCYIRKCTKVELNRPMSCHFAVVSLLGGAHENRNIYILTNRSTESRTYR